MWQVCGSNTGKALFLQFNVLTMKGILLLVLVMAIMTPGMAQKLTPSAEGSAVKFTIKNFGVNTEGSFTGLEGEINFDPADPGAASFNVSVDAATVNTAVEMRDSHLRKSEYFDIQNYPRIKFVSTRITQGKKEGSYSVVGNLTIRDVTKEVTIPFAVAPKEGGYQFTGEFKINRRDFGVGGGSLTLSDNVTIGLSVFGKK